MQLLGVRKNTCNDVCSAESGFPPVNDLVKHNQHKFFYRIWKERSECIGRFFFFIQIAYNYTCKRGFCLKCR